MYFIINYFGLRNAFISAISGMIWKRTVNSPGKEVEVCNGHLTYISKIPLL